MRGLSSSNFASFETAGRRHSRGIPEPENRLVHYHLLLKFLSPAFAIALEIGIEKASGEFCGQVVMCDDGRKIEEWIVVASIFPVEESQIGQVGYCNCNNVLSDEIIVTTAKSRRRPMPLNNIDVIQRHCRFARDDAVSTAVRSADDIETSP